MIDKRVNSISEALSGLLRDRSTVMVGGFGDSAIPYALVHGLLDLGIRDLTIVSNNAGTGSRGISALLESGIVKKVICSYPRSRGAVVIEKLYKAKQIELEVIPQGTFIERMRCAGAGLGGFYTPTGVGTTYAESKEVKTIDGKEYVFEGRLDADVALIEAKQSDRWGNLTYPMASRNFGPVMAMAAKKTVVQVRSLAELGELHPEHIITPGIYVDRVLLIGEDSHE
jgi:3-oxoadipate CoA-transferase alpha subunit